MLIRVTELYNSDKGKKQAKKNKTKQKKSGHYNSYTESRIETLNQRTLVIKSDRYSVEF